MSNQVLVSARRQHFDVFISYRRQEASYLAGWLHDVLGRRFGEDRIFLDVADIRPSSDFVASIRDALRGCRMMLVMIGPNWLGSATRGMPRRIDDPEDPVRLEIEIALTYGVRVLPVLLEGARMPASQALPASLRGLSRLNAVSVGRDSALRDVERLLKVVDDLLDTPGDVPLENLAGVLEAGRSLPSIEMTNRDSERSSKQLNRFRDQLEPAYAEYVRQAVGGGSLRLPLSLVIVPGETFRPADWLLPRNRRQVDEGPKPVGLADVFDLHPPEHDGILLLGGPGAGKTTMLFELATELIDRFRRDPRLPLPVYVPLSSWTAQHTTMTEWLIDQLGVLYQIPTELAGRWIRAGRLLFLLDGLDEIVGLSGRQACVRAINRFVRFEREVLTPTVVVSRQVEYQLLDRQLQLDSAVEVAPLEPLAVLQEMRAANLWEPSTTALVERHEELRDLLRSPLLLSMFLSTRTPLSEVPAPPGMSGRELQRNLISRYIEERLALERATRGRPNRYPPDSTVRWLSELAHHLGSSPQPVFFLDSLDTGWLRLRWTRRLVLVVPSLAWGVCMGTALGIVVMLNQILGLGGGSSSGTAFLACASLGFVAGLVADQPFRRRLAVWLSFGLLGSLATAPELALESIGAVLLEGIVYAIVAGSVGELAVRLLGGELEVVEHLRWSWSALRSGLVRVLASSAVLGVAFVVPNWLASGEPTGRAIFIGVVFGVVIGVVFGLFIGLKRGLGSRSVPIKKRPNEAIVRSSIIGAAMCVSSTLVVGAVFYVSGLLVSPAHGLVRAVAWGPTAGVLWGMTTGLGAVLQYWVLRMLLWQQGVAPLRYSAWLEYAIRLRILYRSVGGGLTFIHGAVQDYFATRGAAEDRPGRG